jgi:hypothetical protein
MELSTEIISELIINKEGKELIFKPPVECSLTGN